MRDAIGPPDAMPAIGRAAQAEAIEMGELDGWTTGVGYMRDGQQHEGVRMHARRPERSLQISRRVWIAWERATPSGAQTIPVVLRPVCRSARASGSRGDIRGCGADTPKRSRRQLASLCFYKTYDATTQYAAWLYPPMLIPDWIGTSVPAPAPAASSSRKPLTINQLC